MFQGACTIRHLARSTCDRILKDKRYFCLHPTKRGLCMYSLFTGWIEAENEVRTRNVD